MKLINKQIQIGTTSITTSLSHEDIEDIKAFTGLDASSELEKILEIEANAAIFDQRVNEEKAKHRQNQIDSVLGDAPFIPLNIEELEEYKKLTPEDKEKYQKYGKIR